VEQSTKKSRLYTLGVNKNMELEELSWRLLLEEFLNDTDWYNSDRAIELIDLIRSIIKECQSVNNTNNGS
jgi:hypothetical protein